MPRPRGKVLIIFTEKENCPLKLNCLAQKLIADRGRFQHAIMRIDSLQVTVATQQAPLERIASLVWLIGELHVARLAHIAVDVKVLVH